MVWVEVKVLVLKVVLMNVEVAVALPHMLLHLLRIVWVVLVVVMLKRDRRMVYLVYLLHPPPNLLLLLIVEVLLHLKGRILLLLLDGNDVHWVRDDQLLLPVVSVHCC